MTPLTTKAAEIRAGLVAELREQSEEKQRVAWSRSDGGLEWSLSALLADSAADALESLLALIEQQAAELAEARALAGPLGWIFTNPATGIGWSEQHPVECGEVPDAEDVQPGYAVHLHHHLIAAWEDARAYAEAAKVQRLAKEAAEAERDELLREKERMGAGWLPIETHRADAIKGPFSPHVLCAHFEKQWRRFGRYDLALKRWYYSGTDERSQWAQVEGDEPTHWMPLPELSSGQNLADANSKSPDPSSQSDGEAGPPFNERAGSEIAVQRQQRIAVLEAARRAVERLANAQINISLEEWNELSGAILAALAPIGEE